MLILRMAGTLLKGLETHSNLPITHTPPAAIELQVRTARKLGRDFARSRAATRRARRKRNEVTARAQAHALTCRQVLVPALGGSWSTEWIPVGWDQNTLMIPQSAESLAELYESLTSHLTDHPELASDKYKVTPQECQSHLDALNGSIREVNGCKSKQRAARDTRDGADVTVADMSKAVVKELELILKPGDPRWIDFIQEVPADVVRPDPVTDLAVDGGAPGELDADWEPGARSDRFLIYVKVVGVDAEPRRLMTVEDESATLTGLPPGKPVEVYVVAANAAGESAPSEVITVTVPMACAA